MNFRKTVLALSVLGAVGMSGCGGSSHDHPVLTSAEGTAIDGYLQGATACFDTNGDKSCSGEASSIGTDINGDFSLSGIGAASAVILVESGGGTTESDVKGVTGGLAGLFTLTAFQGTAIVSPFSTMIQVGVEHGLYASASAGQTVIADALGLGGVNLQTFDFIAAGNVAVTATAEAITDVLENNIAQVAAISTAAGATYGSETILETAILELIDVDTSTGDTVSDFAALATAITAVVVANPTADAATIVADAAVITAVTASNVDAITDAADVGSALDEVNDTNATENDGGSTDGTGGTGGTGAI